MPTLGLEREFNTLDAQEDACRHYIKSQAHLGWEGNPEIFSDAGFSGANTKRPAFAQLMAQVVAGQVDVVVVYKVDRLSRSLLDFSKILGVFEKHHVAFVSITQDFSTATALGRLTLNILMSFSEFEREMISERTGDKIEASRRKGKWTGGLVPLGYEVRQARLHIVPEEAGHVKRIFQWSISGHSATWIAMQLNDLGVHNKSLLRPRPRPWSRFHIVKILRNRIYAGLMSCRGGESAKGEHEGIIPMATFDMVQIMRSPQIRSVVSLHYNPLYIARGALLCPSCRKQISTSSAWRFKTLCRYYRCYGRNPDGSRSCNIQHQLADKVETMLIDKITTELDSQAVLIGIGENQWAQLRREQRAARRGMLAMFGERGNQKIALDRRVNLLNRLEVHLKWFSKIASGFSSEWPSLTLAEKNRFIRTMVDHALMHENMTEMEVVFRDFGGSLVIPREFGG